MYEVAKFVKPVRETYDSLFTPENSREDEDIFRQYRNEQMGDIVRAGWQPKEDGK